MKLKLSQLLFASLIFASFSVTAQESIRCGWVVNQNDSNIELVDSQGVFILAATNPRSMQLHIDLTNGLVVTPKIYIQADSVKVFCACTKLNVQYDKDFLYPFGVVKQYTEKSLETCFKDPMLPSIEKVAR